MEVTFGYRAAPGQCRTCGNSSSDIPAIDLQVYDPTVTHRDWRVYLCGTCVIAAADLVAPHVGYAVVPTKLKDDYMAALAQVDQLTATNNDLATKLAAVANAVETVDL